MIPRSYIAQWREHAPWRSNAQVEQDLIISRALVEIFSDDFLREHLAFRGGTALHKLYLNPAPRYSEDIDLVQIKEGPVKPTLQAIDKRIIFFEEERVVKQKASNNTILYRFTSEDKYKSSMERVGKLVGELSSFPGLNLYNLFELTLFNYITGNNDMHLKNFSLIDRDGVWQLSPAYDLLNVNLVNEKDNEESALTISGKKRRLKKQDFVQLARSYQLTDAQMRNAFDDILSKEKLLLDFIDKSFLTDEFKAKYKEILEIRCAVLKKDS
jgi:hypothetical protein